MSYIKNLKQLREQLLTKATKAPVQETSSESFIPSRMALQSLPEETTEDLIASSAHWLSRIRESAGEYKTPKSGKSGFAKGLARTVASAGTEESPKDEKTTKASFIERRSTERPSTYAPEGPTEHKTVPVDAPVKAVLNALAAVESRGSGDYAARGPVVPKGMYAGQRALGRYQVMEGNIPSWSKAALGRSVSTEEFMANPDIQDAIAAHQLQNSKKKYGTWEDAASVWFSGRPIKEAGNASDGYNTVPEYISKFRKFYES